MNGEVEVEATLAKKKRTRSKRVNPALARASAEAKGSASEGLEQVGEVRRPHLLEMVLSLTINISYMILVGIHIHVGP